MPRLEAKHATWAALAVALLLRLYVGATATGIYYDDEVMQFLEPAHRMVYGRGVVVWEYEEGVRSYVLPSLLAGGMKLMDLVGLDHTDTHWRVFRLGLALLSLLGVLAVARLGELVFSPWVGAGAAWLAAIYAPGLNLAPRVLSDPISASLSLWGLYLAVRCERQGDAADARWAGLFLGLGLALRYQAGLALVAPVAFLAARRRWRDLGQLGLGALPAVALVGAVDTVAWGAPWHSALAYVRINILEGKAASFGTSPFDHYLVALMHTFDYLYPLALVLLVLGLKRSGMAGATFVLTFLTLSLIGHKEYRFLSGVLPIAMLLLSAGTRELCTWFGGSPRLRAASAGLIVAALSAQNVVEARDQTWGLHAEVHDALAWVQRQSGVTGVLTTEGYWKAGGAFMTHLQVPSLYLFEPKREAVSQWLASPSIDTIVTGPKDGGLPTLQRAGLDERGFREVYRNSTWIVFRK